MTEAVGPGSWPCAASLTDVSFVPRREDAETPLGDAPIAGGQLRVEFGFTVDADAAESAFGALATLFADAAFDPDLDRRIAESRCPGCGRLVADVPVGHAWSYDTGTRDYRCSDPPWPGAPAELAMDSHAALPAVPPVAVTIPWEHE